MTTLRDLQADKEDRAEVKRFDELDPWQEDIAGHEDFYRSEVVKNAAGGLYVSVCRNPSHKRRHVLMCSL